MILFPYPWNEAGDAEPPSHVEDTTTRRSRSLGDIAVFIGAIEGRWTKQFIELNHEHIWIPPLRNESQGTDGEEPDRWRGRMPACIRLDDVILCHSFLKPPTGRKGWCHGAETSSSRKSCQRPRDMLYPLNSESGISSSAFCVDYAPGPDMRPAVRITSEVRKPPIRIEIGGQSLALSIEDGSEILERPAKIYLNDNDPDCLNFWLWPPGRNVAERKVFNKHLKAFYDRGNRLDEADFPGIASAGGSTRALSPPSYEPQKPRAINETRIGLTGTVYEKRGDPISRGACRKVFPVKIIRQPCSNLVVPEQAAMQQQPVEPPPEMELVAKEIELNGNDCQSTQKFREIQEKESKWVMDNPHVSLALLFFPIFLARGPRAEVHTLDWPLLTRLCFR